MPTSIELQPVAQMDRLNDLFRSTPDYEPIGDPQQDDDSDSVSEETQREVDGTAFSWVEYSIFLLLGIAMLWAWYGRSTTLAKRR